MDGLVADGCLKFYISSRLGQDTVNRLVFSFKKHLLEISQHCIASYEKNGCIFTPSDFNTVNLSQQLIGRLVEAARLNNNEIIGIYPANSLQQGFIYHALGFAGDDAYRVQMLWDYH